MQESTEDAFPKEQDWLDALERQVDEELSAIGEGRTVSEPPPRSRPFVGHRIADDDDVRVRIVHSPCRCWRCRGGVALSDRPVLDRLLGLHLSRLPVDEQNRFLAGWAANPRHAAQDGVLLSAWIRIAEGSQEDEPVYRGEWR